MSREPRAIITSLHMGPDGPEQFSATVLASEVTEQLRQIIANGGDIVSVEPFMSEQDEEDWFRSREPVEEGVPF